MLVLHLIVCIEVEPILNYFLIQNNKKNNSEKKEEDIKNYKQSMIFIQQ